MKTFENLKFEQHSIANSGIATFENARHAVEYFDNEYGISVLFGGCFYSNGIDTYEVVVLFNNQITYNTDITHDVMGYLSANEVTEVMEKIQLLK